MCIPVIKGVKTESERFAGAVDTYCIEAMMQDGKALQAGTSHFLGQNFAKAFDVKYATKQGVQEYVWATSWGVSTRLMGALIMTHSDDRGLVLPPKLAPLQVVIVPIYKSMEQLEAISVKALEIAAKLKARGITVKFDDDDTKKPGWKFAEYELKGVPLRLGIGPRDLENGEVELARRDTSTKEQVKMEGVDTYIEQLLEQVQKDLFQKALKMREETTHHVDNFEAFKAALDKGGFVYAHWDGTPETEEKIKELTKATIRCIPLGNPLEHGICVYSGKPSAQRVVFARAY
jgi:prolyl-tRNA synthetase